MNPNKFKVPAGYKLIGLGARYNNQTIFHYKKNKDIYCYSDKWQKLYCGLNTNNRLGRPDINIAIYANKI